MRMQMVVRWTMMEVATRGMERDVTVIEEWRDVEVSGNVELRLVEDWLSQDEGTKAEGSQSRGEGMRVVMKASRDEEMPEHSKPQGEGKIVEGL
jgi:hypothetical protein